MSSNILLDPIPELTQALKTNSFGILPSSLVILEQSFPHTPEDKASVREESAKTGRTSGRVVARARIGLLEGGEIEVVLDQRGYTIESAKDPASGTLTHPLQTYESLESLLIAISPGYVEAMTAEVGKRFEGYQGGDDGKTTEQQEAEAEGGEQAAWNSTRT